ncbi:hypothetical protein KKF34_16870 [Myxococcota bacterium]|nr:hypothetical protein [Myxococcota bacterium]MBU1381985.1 hypothetical protein [Myxococcota bacterium]MBU1498552.1 hypothetical protein [Myxococcota bacterium]
MKIRSLLLILTLCLSTLLSCDDNGSSDNNNSNNLTNNSSNNNNSNNLTNNSSNNNNSNNLTNNSSNNNNSNNNTLNPEETFTEDDAPVDLSHESRTFKSPWGYEKEANSSRLYPLLVSGMWGEGQSYYYQQVDQDFPAFVIDYQYDGQSDGQALAQWIQSAVEAGFRIDTNRIYLTGFSRGGSGSFPLAKGMYDGGMYFAAIIRVAGQSQSDLGNDIAEQTAVWYHIGLNDTETRVQVARDTLENMRNYDCNSSAAETEDSDDITGHDRTTVTLTRNGYKMFVYSEYTGMGHDPGPCYTDQALFPWLFSHSLSFR